MRRGVLCKKTKMRLIRLNVILIAIVLFFSCKNDKDEIKIGLLIPASDGYRWPTDKFYIEKAAKKQNVEVVTKSAENDENLQLKQAGELLDEGVDVLIVVAANANTAGAIVRYAEEYDVPVIAYDRLLQNCDLNYFISFNEKKIADIMLSYSLEKIPKGNYVMLWGEASDPNAVAIKEEQERMLNKYVENGDITIVYKTYIDNWSRENACHKMKKIIDLSGVKIDAVITSYDGLALGVVDAYNEYGIDELPIITGQDAELEALRNIVDNKISFTVYKSIKTIANTSVDLAISLAKGEKYDMTNAMLRFNGRKDVPSIMLDPIPVDINTIRTVVIADSLYSEEEVYIN